MGIDYAKLPNGTRSELSSSAVCQACFAHGNYEPLKATRLYLGKGLERSGIVLFGTLFCLPCYTKLAAVAQADFAITTMELFATTAASVEMAQGKAALEVLERLRVQVMGCKL